jgi:hypothetical protein
MPRSRDAAETARARAAHEEARGEVTVRLDPDSERGIRATCAICFNKLTICRTTQEKAVLARVSLDKLHVTVWPNRPNLFGLASSCNAVDDIVCCADSEDIRNEWIAVFRRLGIDVATKLGASEEEYLDAWFAGIEIHGDALKARLARKVRRLEEQQARARRAEHCAVPALLCDTADQKGLKRSLAVEASVTGDMHLESLEIRRGGVLEVSLAFAELRISRIGADRVFGFVPLEHPELGMFLYFEDDASFSEFLGQRWPTNVFLPSKVVLSCEEKMKAPG